MEANVLAGAEVCSQVCDRALSNSKTITAKRAEALLQRITHHLICSLKAAQREV